MAPDQYSEFIDAALLFRSKHPDPVTFHTLMKEVRNSTGKVPRRTGFKEALLGHDANFSKWVLDLETEPAVGDAASLLERWVSQPDDRVAIQPALETALTGTLADPEVREAAVALGATSGSADWHGIRHDRLPHVILSALIDVALASGQPGWAIDTLCLSSVPLSKTLKDRFSEVDVKTELADRLARWPALLDEQPAVSEAMPKLLQLVGLHPGRGVRSAALRGAFALSAAERIPKWGANLIGVATTGPEDTLPDLNEYESPEILRLLLAMSTAFAVKEDHRTSLLRWVASSPHAHVLSDRRVWRGVPPETIGAMVQDQEVGERLLEIAGEAVFRTVTVQEANRYYAWQILQLVGRFPRLARFVTADHLRRAAQRSDASAGLVRALVDLELAELSDRLRATAATGEDLQRQVSNTADELAAARLQVQRHQEENAALRTRITDQARAKSSLREAEVNQSRIDVLRALVDSAEALRLLDAVSGAASDVVHGIHRDIERRLGEFGVQIIGTQGERRPARPDIDVPKAPGRLVEVISPAYVFGNPSTPLRQAVVRVIEEETGG